MIAWRVIVEAAAITAVAVALAALLVRWEPRNLVIAGGGAFLLLLSWRAIANGAHWNDDFVRLISVGDVGCLLAGAAAPALLARTRRATPHRLVPALAGGLVGLVINVIIL